MWRRAQAVAMVLMIIGLVAPSALARPIDCEQHCELKRGKAKRAKCRRHCERRCRKPPREACYTGRNGKLACCVSGTACCGDRTCCPDAQACCATPEGTPFCADLGSDPANCGGCGVACAPGQSCCHSVCVDPVSDSTNCGACGQICGYRQSCLHGQCIQLCASPYATPCFDREHPDSEAHACCEAPLGGCCNNGTCAGPAYPQKQGPEPASP